VIEDGSRVQIFKAAFGLAKAMFHKGEHCQGYSRCIFCIYIGTAVRRSVQNSTRLQKLIGFYFLSAIVLVEYIAAERSLRCNMSTSIFCILEAHYSRNEVCYNKLRCFSDVFVSYLGPGKWRTIWIDRCQTTMFLGYLRERGLLVCVAASKT
jgi:hypothetical protein